jgi:parallel beta-helix repeat protein
MIKDLVITGGSYFYGGGIVCGSLSTTSSATIEGCTVTGNEGGFGGGIFASADNVIKDCTIENNVAIASGGGIYCLSSQNTITDCTVEDNTAASEGGGIYSFGFGELLISGCTITGNICQDDGEGGGAGIRGYLGDTIIIDCTISNNTAASVGGGIMTSSTTTISGCRISDNTGGFGGGLSSVSTHLITISGTVVCGNTSGQIHFDDWIDGGDNCVQDSCDDCDEVCPGDFDGNGRVDSADLGLLIAAWNTKALQYDLNEDGAVNAADLGLLIGAWGDCP